MSELTDQDVEAILKIFEDSDFDYLEFQQGDLHMTVAKRGYVPPVAPAAAIAAPPVANPVPAQTAPPSQEPSAPAAQDAPKSEEKECDGLVPVIAPMVGTFYSAPDPQSPAYVTQGDTVSADNTVGLIEVMKVFTAILAETQGEIVEIMVENAATVQQGDVLFYIKPAG